MYSNSNSSQSICRICFEPIDKIFFLDEIIHLEVVCKKCREIITYKIRVIHILGIHIWGLLPYKGDTRLLMLRFKEGKDRYIAEVLMRRLSFLRFIPNAVVVCVPSNARSIQERGFEPSSELGKYLGLPLEFCVINSSLKQQKYNTVEERKEVGKFLTGTSLEKLENKTVFIVDDILTTGSTMKAMHDIIKPHCKRVFCIVNMYTEPK